MNPKYLGDSYDIVKRYFCQALQSLGYTVYADLRSTAEWNGEDQLLYRLLGAHAHTETPMQPASLFLDPDTGVARKDTRSHISFQTIASRCSTWEIVFAFDQSFSRAGPPRAQLQAKLATLRELGCFGFYYDSHARFLFASRNIEPLRRLREVLVSQGLPGWRLEPFIEELERERPKAEAVVAP
jgi:hypothetical protein